MTSETELILLQQLSAIMQRLDNIECKIDKILMSGQLQQDGCTTTEADQISQDVREKLTNALVRKRAKAAARLNEKI